MNTPFDTITSEDLRKLYRDMILEKYNFPTKQSSDGYYHVYVKTESGRKQIKDKNLENLKEKVYKYESKLFKEVYELTKEEKLKYTKNPEKLISVKNTIRVTDQTYNRFLAGSDLESEPIANITKNLIEEFCMSVLTTQDVNKKAFLNMRSILKTTLQYAHEHYWIPENPYTRINFRKYNDMLIDTTPVSKRAHTQEEIDQMLDYLHEKENITPEYLPAWALELQILMGLRRGEIAPLEWSDIYDGVIHITKEQLELKETGEYIIVNHTKTYTDRVFPITNVLQDYFNRLKNISTDNRLFPNLGNRAVYKLYRRMCAKLGIQISRESIKGPHSFRRNGITNVCNVTGSMELAAMLYGNSPQCISKHYYTGINITEVKRVLDGNQMVTKI